MMMAEAPISRPSPPRPEDYVVVPGSQGPRRDFRISVGLREGWDAEGRVFDVSEAVRTARACTCAVLRPTEKTIAETRAALDAGSRSRSYWCDSLILSRLAEAALAAGDPASTGAALQEAFAFVEQSGERFWLADLHRVDGDIALKRPEPDRARAEACFLKAIDTARSQEARILELRAAIDLARRRRETGSPNGARALLEPIFAQVESGETTRETSATPASY